MALLRVNNNLRLGGVFFGESKDPFRRDIIPRTLGTDTQSLVDYYLKNGFSAAYDPGVEDRTQLEEIKAAFAEADIVISETPAYAINILETDLALREKNIEEICRRLERAEMVGSLCCVGHGGSVSHDQWGAHNPENFSQESFDTTVEIIQRIVDTVKPENTKLALETESRLLPDSPDTYLELIKAVDRPSFAVHLDPFNIISNPRRFYFSGDFIRECFAKLGEYIVSCHAKDIQMMHSPQVHFEETFAGNGGIDFKTYISEVVKLKNDVPMMMEHYPEPEQNRGRDYIYAQAAAVGVPIRHAEFRESR